MSLFANLSVAKKLGFGFGIIVFLVVFMGGLSLIELGKVNAETVDIATNWLPSVSTINQLRFDASCVRRDALNFVVSIDKKQHYQDKVASE